MKITEFTDTKQDPSVRGFLHTSGAHTRGSLVLTHGAGGNANMAMLVALAEAFAGEGFAVLRCDLPFRQSRRSGPPRPADAAGDQQGLKNAANAMRKKFPAKIYLGGQSYGGRQASMLLAEDGSVADGLLLLSYPLHPPGRPEQLRTQHLPKLGVPTMIVHGSADPFATTGEIEAARKIISGKTKLVEIEGAGHDLGYTAKKKRDDVTGLILEDFLRFFA